MHIYIDNTHLRNYIKHLMDNMDITYTELASRLDMSVQTLYSLLRKKQLSFADVDRICKALDCNLVLDITPSRDADFAKRMGTYAKAIYNGQDNNIDSTE